MSQNARDWLPIETLATPSVRAVFEAAVANWSVRWFGDRHVTITDVCTRRAKPSVGSAKTGWYCFAPGIFLDWGDHVQLALAHHGLHTAAAHTPSSNPDVKLIAAFAERVVDDLVDVLAKPIGTKRNDVPMPGHPYQDDGGLAFRLVSGDGSLSVGVGISASALVGLRKAQCPAYKSTPAEPFKLVEALGNVQVPFKVSLGNARMTARELTGLTLDDIVILDTAHDAPIVLTAEGSNKVLCATELGRDGEELTLKTIEFEGVAA